ncbi:hypothetical protein [Planctomycetes bacterium TBK1r]|uniref:SMP-30/Gluconolactonase/LRE-like region domain-containing protein n=1 Tax=Stieleria magnilauensis TaxID=2527963 RepID=A0ABX5Y0D4_9BACT|nr:hypothetical protein TBK1r_62290 [Planctomycetes bacterium TBK1r]
MGYLGICKFNIESDPITLVDCAGPSRDAQVYQPIYVSPDGSMVAQIGCASNGKGKLVGQHHSGTIVVSSADLGELKLDATLPGNNEGFAFDPSSQTVFASGGKQIPVRRPSQSEPIEIPMPIHGLNSTILSASPAGAGTFISFVNNPFWLHRVSDVAPEQR